MSSPSCDRCGSSKLRRARTRTDWQRLIRKLTPLHRYACGACGHRGWTSHPLERDRTAEGESANLTPSRPLEARDYRAARGLRVRVVVTVLAATLLGAMVAWFLSRGSPE